MKIKDCMKQNVYVVGEHASIREAAKLFVDKHIGSLPVVDKDGKLVGLLQLRDLLELVMPDFVGLIADFDFVTDFGVVESRVPPIDILTNPVGSIMHAPISVNADSGLIRAYSLLQKHQLHDLPVVDDHKALVGIASRVDIGTAFVANWNVLQEIDE